MNAELALLGRILTLANDEDVNIDAFGEVVASSPSLAAQVVKVANSALYGMEGKITRLERAVLILGVRTVASIASSVLVANRMRQAQIPNLSNDALWMHSLEVGACAELLARCLGWPLEAEAYLSGLLHDLGIAELATEHGPAYAEALAHANAQPGDLAAAEREKLGTDHGERLAELAESWGFPQTIREVIRHHHDPASAPEKARAVASLVEAAHAVVEAPLEGWDDMAGIDATAVLEAIGLGPDDVHDVRLTLAERLKDMVAALCA